MAAVLLAVALAAGWWCLRWIQGARSQRSAVAAIGAHGGVVDERQGAAPRWLAGALGEDYFTTVSKVTFASDGDPSAAMPALAGLTELRSLDLSGARVSDEDLAPLAELTSLEALFLRNTPIGDDGLKHLAALEELRRLDLSGTRVTDSGMRVICRLSRLERLWLEDTQLRGDWLVHARSLPRLELLALSRSAIVEKNLVQLANLPSLSTLRLEDTAVTDAGLAHLAPLTHLNGSLYLAGCPISDDGLDHLALLTRLKLLDLRRTGISSQGGVRIRQSLPFCDVAVDGG